jgi:competence protein ComFC
VIDFLLDLIYPPRCIFCRSIIPVEKERGICENCKEMVSFVKGKQCQKCGKPIEDRTDKKLCVDCMRMNHYYEKGFALFVYEGLVRDMIYRFKYGGHKEYARHLGKWMADVIIKADIKEKIDLIIPVPIHPNRKKKRGYNQSEELARVLAKELKIPMNASALIRKKDTIAQSGLTFLQRRNNMKNAFEFDNGFGIYHKNILLVDDIYTTGATINACSKLLKKKSANTVYFLAVSIGRDFS